MSAAAAGGGGAGNNDNDNSDHEEFDASDFCYFERDCRRCYRGGGHRCLVLACGCEVCRESAKHRLETALRLLAKAEREGYSDDYGDGEDNRAEVKAAAIARVKQARDNLVRELDAYLAGL